MAPAYTGPWAAMQIGQVPAPVVAVPVEYDKISPGHLKKHGSPPYAGHHPTHPAGPQGRESPAFSAGERWGIGRWCAARV
jgi:hypothetical protein